MPGRTRKSRFEAGLTCLLPFEYNAWLGRVGCREFANLIWRCGGGLRNMTKGKKGSRKARTGAGSRPGSEGQGSQERSDVGRLTAEEQEGIFLRRVIFSVVVVVVGFLSVWFVLNTVNESERRKPVLSATDSAPPASAVYTVKLMEFSPAMEPRARRLTEMDAVKDLAGANEFVFLSLPDGQMALCVGRFESPDSPQLRLLLEACRGFEAMGQRLFVDASVCQMP